MSAEAWDWEYYSEKVRAEKYQIDENLVKPYFEIESVLQNGVFYTYGKLYGIRFNERKDLPVYHPTVRVFDVLGADGKQIGLFYADYFHRDAKQGGRPARARVACLRRSRSALRSARSLRSIRPVRASAQRPQRSSPAALPDP